MEVILHRSGDSGLMCAEEVVRGMCVVCRAGTTERDTSGKTGAGPDSEPGDTATDGQA